MLGFRKPALGPGFRGLVAQRWEGGGGGAFQVLLCHAIAGAHKTSIATCNFELSQNLT